MGGANNMKLFNYVVVALEIRTIVNIYAKKLP
jgi:hypothetical protein